MQKLLFIALAVVSIFASCKKEDEDSRASLVGTYNIVADITEVQMNPMNSDRDTTITNGVTYLATVVLPTEADNLGANQIILGNFDNSNSGKIIATLTEDVLFLDGDYYTSVSYTGNGTVANDVITLQFTKNFPYFVGQYTVTATKRN